MGQITRDNRPVRQKFSGSGSFLSLVLAILLLCTALTACGTVVVTTPLLPASTPHAPLSSDTTPIEPQTTDPALTTTTPESYGPPSATPLELLSPVDQPLNAAQFCDNMSTVTEIVYTTEPDWTLLGPQSVSLMLIGPDGQTTPLEASLTLWQGSLPPVFDGVADIEIEIGETIAYKSGVTVTDDRDSNIKFTVDNSAVIPEVLGQYPVIYSATDSDGNVTSITVTLSVNPFDVEKLYELVDETIAKIITDEMTPDQQVRAIYNFAQTTIAYVSHGDKGDRDKVAYQGLRDHRGDCYTYAVVAEALFDRLGIDYVSIERLGSSTRHYWSLVNLGEGYYHFDCTPHRTKKYDTCMITQSRLNQIMADRGYYYYRYDPELYPETVA